MCLTHSCASHIVYCGWCCQSRMGLIRVSLEKSPGSVRTSSACFLSFETVIRQVRTKSTCIVFILYFRSLNARRLLHGNQGSLSLLRMWRLNHPGCTKFASRSAAHPQFDCNIYIGHVAEFPFSKSNIKIIHFVNKMHQSLCELDFCNS